MTKKPAVAVGWAGGIYGIIGGVVLVTQPIYSRASARVSPGQEPVLAGPEPAYLDPSSAAIGMLITALSFGSALALLMVRRREAFTW